MSDISDQRRYYERMMDEIAAEHQKQLDQLRTENAKLRELVADMLHWMPCVRPCGHCERYRYPEGCEFAIRMRELGVDDV